MLQRNLKQGTEQHSDKVEYRWGQALRRGLTKQPFEPKEVREKSPIDIIRGKSGPNTGNSPKTPR